MTGSCFFINTCFCLSLQPVKAGQLLGKPRIMNVSSLAPYHILHFYFQSKSRSLLQGLLQMLLLPYHPIAQVEDWDISSSFSTLQRHKPAGCLPSPESWRAPKGRAAIQTIRIPMRPLSARTMTAQRRRNGDSQSAASFATFSRNLAWIRELREPNSEAPMSRYD